MTEMIGKIEESKAAEKLGVDEGSCLMKDKSFDRIEAGDETGFGDEANLDTDSEKGGGEDTLEADFDLDLGELTIELDDEVDDFDLDDEDDLDAELDDDLELDLELDLDSDWDDEELDDEPEPEPSQPQSLKAFAEDWENRWAEWKWMDDH